MLDEEMIHESKNVMTHQGGTVVRCTFKIAKGGAKLGVKGTIALVELLLKGARKAIRSAQGQKGKSIKELSKDGSQIDIMQELDKSYTEGFHKYAKKYDVSYSIMRHKDDRNLYTLFFKCKDVNKLEKALGEYCKDKGLDLETLDQKIQKAKEARNKATKPQEKVKGKAKKKAKYKHKEVSR